MNDLERDLRTLFDAKSGDAPMAPKPPSNLLRRARARQLRTAIVAGLGAVAIVVGSVAGIRALVTADGTTTADQPTETSTLNGISITHPQGWVVVDPDAAGLNGSGPQTGFPRLILALSPIDTGEMLACPGMVEGTKPTFLMTLQEEPLAAGGADSVPWPVQLEPLSVESEGATDGTAVGGCYPGWEFLRAGWTASDRTFEARVGFAGDITDEDREAVLGAFASMTFAERSDTALESVVVATGTAGGEEWELIARRQPDGLSLSLDAETFGTGSGSYDPDAGELQLTSHVFGRDDAAEIVVFGAVPASVVRIGVRIVYDDEGMLDVLDVPDAIDPDLNAFVFTLPGHLGGVVNAYDGDGEILASGEFNPAAIDPADPPTLPREVIPEHGETYWGLYLAVGESLEEAELDEAIRQAEFIGYTPAVGDITCDDGAAAELGVPEQSSGVAIYFATREDAEAAAAMFEPLPVGIAEVTTYCLD